METAEYTWTPDFKLDVAGEITFTRADDGSGQSVPKDDYTLAITDASGAQVTGKIYDAGTYTVKVTMESDNYVLSEGGDSFTITVRPLDLSSADVKIILPAGRVPMPVYTGKSVYPQIEGNML